MTALECFNEFEARRLWKLKEDEVFKNISISFKFVTNLINVDFNIEERAKKHSTPVHIQTAMFLKIEWNDFFEIFLNVVRCW